MTSLLQWPELQRSWTSAFVIWSGLSVLFRGLLYLPPERHLVELAVLLSFGVAMFVVGWSLTAALHRLERRDGDWALYAFVAATLPIHGALWYGPVAHVV